MPTTPPLASRPAKARYDSTPESAAPFGSQSEHQLPIVLLRRPQVLEKLGICRSALHQWLDPESPYFVPDMPRPIKLFARSRSSYWIEEEINLFIQRRVARARQAVPQGAQQ